MRLATLLGPDLKATLESEPEALREALEDFHIEDVAEIVDDLAIDDAVAILQALPDEAGADVMERLSAERQLEVLDALGIRESVPLISEMAPDELVDLVQELPDALADELLDEMEKEEPEAVEEVRELSAWEPETAGGLMTPDYVGLTPQTKVWQAIEQVRRLSRDDEVETISYIYVIAFGGKLLGVLSLRQLILADTGQILQDVMRENVVRVAPTDDQEKVAHSMAHYDLNAMPVVDEHGVMLGVITIDDVVDVVIEEATEDVHMMGGVVPLEDSYLETGFLRFVWKRGVWLVLLFIGQMLTANVLEHQHQTLVTVASLVVFIPLIISSGGNSGSQSASLVIRAMAVGEVSPSDWLRVIRRELAIGITLGLMLGVGGFARAYISGDTDAQVLSVVVGASTAAVVLLGTILGSLLPLLIRRLGLDPAVSSTPFIASLSDVLGLLVYFAIARLVFGLVL